MKCPHCGNENESTARFCSSCGSALPGEAGRQGMKAVTTGGLVLGKAAREARLKEIVDPSAIVDSRVYNGIIGAVLLWGFLINYLLCLKVGSFTSLFPEMSPLVFVIGYFVLAITGILVTNKSRNPLISFLGYNLVVIPFGLMVSTVVEGYGGVGADVVTQAFLYTALVAVAMVATAVVFPQIFEKISTALGAVLLCLVLCEIVLLILRVDQIVTSWIAVGLFSLYLGYDVYRSQLFPKTVKNAVLSALDIYLDLANLFLRLLRILGRRRD